MRKCTLWAWESQLETVNTSFLFRRIWFRVFDFRGNAFLENGSRVLGYTHTDTLQDSHKISFSRILLAFVTDHLTWFRNLPAIPFPSLDIQKSSSPVRRCESFSPYNSLLFRRCLGERKLLKKVFGCIGLGHFPTIQMYPRSRFRSAGASITWCASEGYDNCSKTGDYLVRGGWSRMIHVSFFFCGGRYKIACHWDHKRLNSENGAIFCCVFTSSKKIC